MEENTQNNDYIRNFLDGVYTKDEAGKMLDLVKKDPENEDLSQIISEVWDETAYISPSESLQERLKYEKEAHEIINTIKDKNRTRKIHPYLRKISLATASVAAILILALGIHYFKNWYDINNITYITETTTYGDKKTLQLPDGTTVYLNACAKIIYPDRFVEDMRQVQLEGEAYFDVKRNEEKPFIVKTHAFDVKVLGTEFDIKAYKGDEIISVNVESGKVQVDMPDAMVRLGAKEQVEINTITADYYKYKDDTEVAVWRSGSLRFNRTPIKDVAKELERTYNYQISFRSGQEFSNLITGEHTNKDLIAVLNSIEFTSGIHYRIDENLRRVLLYK